MRCFFLLVTLACTALGHRSAGAQPTQVAPVNVVLMHGFTDTGDVFDPLVRVLEAHGCRCFAPSLRPKNFRYGVRDLTLKLSAEIDARLGKSARFVLVGQSMGGLVARDYVQNLHQGRRVRAFFEIATANGGTLLANASPGGGVRDFAIGSPFLRALNSDLSAWRQIPVYAYWTPFDLVVAPPFNERCAFGQSRIIFSPFHQYMADHPVVMADIARRIDALPVAGR